MKLVFAPGNVNTVVRSIEMHHQPMERGIPGDVVGFNVKGISVKDLHRGFVASDALNDPAG